MSFVRQADDVLYLFDDPVNEMLVAQLAPNARNLGRHYVDGRLLMDSYRAMIDEILGSVRAGRRVCVALYGHPGVFAFPTHEAIRIARSEGFASRMLPAVSAEDCLFADLGVDPGHGCQCYEATDFLVSAPRFDSRRSLILWQVGGIGEMSQPLRSRNDNLEVLAEALKMWYPADHGVVIYEGARYAFHEPDIQQVSLQYLSKAAVNSRSTLYVPPHGKSEPKREMLARIGISSVADIS